jgi:hypothetical protein
MNRFKYSLLAAAGILTLAFILTAIGPKRVMAALGYTPVRDIDVYARQPVLVALSSNGSVFYDVPAKKRLVIEFISFDSETFGGGIYGIGLQIWDAAHTGYTNWIDFPVTLTADTGGVKYFSHACATKIYVEPLTALRLDISATTANPYAHCTFSGYLEPL